LGTTIESGTWQGRGTWAGHLIAGAEEGILVGHLMGGKGAQVGQTVLLKFSGHLFNGQILLGQILGVGQILGLTVGQILGLGQFSGGQRLGKEKDGQSGQFFSGQI
jgi:hypothetical protein